MTLSNLLGSHLVIGFFAFIRGFYSFTGLPTFLRQQRSVLKYLILQVSALVCFNDFLLMSQSTLHMQQLVKQFNDIANYGNLKLAHKRPFSMLLTVRSFSHGSGFITF